MKFIESAQHYNQTRKQTREGQSQFLVKAIIGQRFMNT